MKRNKPKEPCIFKGKSNDYCEGYTIAEDYFKHLIKGGSKTGSAPFRVFVEAVAFSIRRKEKIRQHRVKSLEIILSWSDSEFNKGVYDLLVKKSEEYNTGVELNAVPEV